MKKKERIFIADVPVNATFLLSEVTAAFRRCQLAANRVEEFGLPVTTDTINDCLTLRKVTERREVEGVTKYVGDLSTKFQKEFEAVEVITGDVHLRQELEKLISDVIQGGTGIVPKQKAIEAMKHEYEDMLEKIYNIFHVARKTYNTDSLLRYLIVENGQVSLPDDIDERIRLDTAIYAETEKGKAAYRLHKEIAESLNALADILVKQDRQYLINNISELFFTDENGNVQPSPLDYDLYTD